MNASQTSNSGSPFQFSLKWFLACALKELTVRLESEVYGAQICLNPIRKITFAPDGQVESFLLDFPAVDPGGAYI